MLGVLLVSLMVGVASAGDRLNHEMMLRLQAVHVFGADHPWGARLGATQLYSLADHCSYSERDCRVDDRGMPGSLWPLLGPALDVEWRGGPRFGVDLTAEAGLGSVDMHQFGFMPYWVVMATPGLRWTQDQGLMLLLGGYVGKSFSGRFATPTTQSYQLNGGDGILARVGLGTGYRGRAGWASSVLSFGVQTSTGAGDYF